MWTMPQKCYTLAFAQIGAAFEQSIARGQRVEPLQLQQQLRCQSAAAGTQFENVAARFAQDRRKRVRKTACEDKTQFRCGDEVARGAKLGCARAVIAKARGI